MDANKSLRPLLAGGGLNADGAGAGGGGGGGGGIL